MRTGTFPAKHNGVCEKCKMPIDKGMLIVALKVYKLRDKSFFHAICGEDIKEIS